MGNGVKRLNIALRKKRAIFLTNEDKDTTNTGGKISLLSCEKSCLILQHKIFMVGPLLSKSPMWWFYWESGTDVLLFIRTADEHGLAVKVASFHFPPAFRDNEQCLQLQPDLPSNTSAISFYTSVKMSQSVFHRLWFPRAAQPGAVKFWIPRLTLELSKPDSHSISLLQTLLKRLMKKKNHPL